MATFNKTWKRVPHRYTLKEAVNIGPLAIQKMDTYERAELAQFLHNQFWLRVNTFVNANTVPYALTKFVSDYHHEVNFDGQKVSIMSRMGIDLDENPIVTRNGKRMINPAIADANNPHNALMSYIRLHQDFFTWKSATVTGWREIGKKEDVRLYGTETKTRRVRYIDENGKTRYRYETFETPKYRMTDGERRAFWRLYEDIRKTDWTSINDYSSESQQEFARIWMSGKFDHTDIEAAYHYLQERLDARPRTLREYPAGMDPELDPFTGRRVPENWIGESFGGDGLYEG